MWLELVALAFFLLFITRAVRNATAPKTSVRTMVVLGSGARWL